MKALSLVCVSLFSLSISSAFAAPSAYWMKGPCGPDVQKYCMDAPAGGVIACLKSHETEKDAAKKLSEACEQKFKSKRGEADQESAASEKKK